MPLPCEGARTTKKWNFTTMVSSRSGNKTKRPPCWTLEELAAKFGVTAGSLKSYMQHHPGAPAATNAGRTSHYPVPAMVKWWNEVIEPKRSVSHSLLTSDN